VIDGPGNKQSISAPPHGKPNILTHSLEPRKFFLQGTKRGFRNLFSLMMIQVNPLKPELNLICYLLALLGAHHFLHVSRIRVKLLTFRLLMS